MLRVPIFNMLPGSASFQPVVLMSGATQIRTYTVAFSVPYSMEHLRGFEMYNNVRQATAVPVSFFKFGRKQVCQINC